MHTPNKPVIPLSKLFIDSKKSRAGMNTMSDWHHKENVEGYHDLDSLRRLNPDNEDFYVRRHELIRMAVEKVQGEGLLL